MFLASFVTLSCFVIHALSAYPEAPRTFEASQYTEWHNLRSGQSRRGNIQIDFKNDKGEDDSISMLRLDLVGSPYERGHAQGRLLFSEIMRFQGPKLDEYYMQMILAIDLSKFPEPLQKIFRVVQVKGAVAAPAAFREAMHWVWESEKMYVPEYIIEEIDGMANGICDAVEHGCNVTEWKETLQNTNMLPELIRMACTAFGAWGKSTPSGEGLVQMRALDFGGGPFANYTVVAVHRDPSRNNPFVSVSFPGFVGVITGVSQSGIGISEKIWETYDTIGIQPGSYHGEADVLVLRDILELTKNRKEAEDYLVKAHRTWTIFIGIGDYETKKFDLVGYKQDTVTVYDDVTAPSVTGQPYLENIAYVDKHPQPTGEGPEGTLPTALSDFYGNITLENCKTIIQYHKSGDLHIAAYDFEAKEMYLSIGKINVRGEYNPVGGADSSEWKAYNRPYLKFNLMDLWEGK